VHTLPLTTLRVAKKSSAAAKPRNVVRATTKPGVKSSASWKENLKGILGTVAIFLFIRIFFFEAYRIPSPSMVPAMLVGDWLFVNKLVYGPHIPFTNINLPGYAEPKRYDISVFVSPTQVDQPWDPNPTLVKRLVGLPGDTLYMRDAKLFVDGIEQRQGYGAESDPGDPNETSPLFEWQAQYALKSSRFGPAPTLPTHDNWGPLVIPAGHYFMMGDNRYNSKDSRYWGIVPRENFRGRPLFVYYSWDAESTQPLAFLTQIRWGRIGHWIK
jgi:signal peptidase I